MLQWCQGSQRRLTTTGAMAATESALLVGFPPAFSLVIVVAGVLYRHAASCHASLQNGLHCKFYSFYF